MRCSAVEWKFVRLAGDDLISVSVPGPAAAQSLAEHLRQSGNFTDVVAGIDSVVVRFDATSFDGSRALQMLEPLIASQPQPNPDKGETINIPVEYGGDAGPDLASLCEQLGLPESEFVRLHTSRAFPVEMLGFTPGFAYIGSLDECLRVPRLPEPRKRVPAGSIGIAGGRSGLYALPGPGGWPLVGRTKSILFDQAASEPFAIRPGMKVRFVDARPV